MKLVSEKFNLLIDYVERVVEENKRRIARALSWLILAVTVTILVTSCLLVANVSLSLAGGLEGPEPTKVAVVEPTPTDLPPSATPVTPTPTSTPEPTATVTKTPKPTPTDPPPTPTIDSREADYVVWGVGIGDEMSALFTELVKQNRLLEINPYLINDQEWNRETGRVVSEITALGNEIINYPLSRVPERFQPAHAELVLGAKDINMGMDAYTIGIRDINEDKINEAAELITSGTEHIARATDLMPPPPDEEG